MTAKLQKITWQQIRHDVCKVNSTLADILDAIDPGKNLPILKASYAFGEKVLDGGKLARFASPEYNKICQEQVTYSPVPLGLFLNKTCEAYVEINDRIIPIFVQGPGATVGKFETLNILEGLRTNPPWNLRAGARSLFMLAKINNALWHKRLIRHYGITTQAPRSVTDQWEVFTDLVNSPQSGVAWQCDVIFFTDSWFKQLAKNKTFPWVRFREYLYQSCYPISADLLDKSFSFFWQYFASSTIVRNYKPRIYISDTIRHLISIGHGILPGFAPATNEQCAPINFLKQAYCEIYDLPHLPTLIEPAFVTPGGRPIYYSLGYPSLLEGYPELDNIYNTISDLKEIKYLLNNMQAFFLNRVPDINKFLLDIREIDFDYFHKIPDKQAEVKESKLIVESDRNFLLPDAGFKNRSFCATSPFLNGCIQISKKPQK